MQAQEAESEYVEENVDASNASNAEKYGLADNTKDGVILHAFCWSFNTIKENMKDIATAGYDAMYGARPVKRVVQREVVGELSKRILAGEVNRERPITIDAVDGALHFSN